MKNCIIFLLFIIIVSCTSITINNIEIELIDKIEYYDKNDKLTHYSLYEYNEYGQIVSTNFYNVDNKLIESTVFNYDKNKGLIEIISYYHGRFSNKISYEYYPEINQITKIITSSKRIESKKILTYKNNVLINEEISNYNGEVINMNYKYDNIEDDIIRYCYSDKMELLKKDVYIFDKGNIISYEHYYKNGRKIKYTFEYDIVGKLVKQEILEEDPESKNRKIEYNIFIYKKYKFVEKYTPYTFDFYIDLLLRGVIEEIRIFK